MQGHSYVTLRKMRVQKISGDGEVEVLPGTVLPREITDTWTDVAVRAMINQKHIQFASLDQETPFLAKTAKASRVDAATQPAPKTKGRARAHV